ncbi:hypothetical protein SARC_11956 [Sphaeroforma arctica JP610]|uniref:Cyclin N-terminal domain-containing protein n=1 Tax=Sphaeroforma arctica JP610 TaxID=667725 RepID=A0A0L0FHK9_9EUKA|nr:hypothetical protein SARC_11956 [Sphaeroforma arctica JP610]KNC75523.1 hypothetical protein SARC_11956 [Sphaeroforma arctica JP610]|eukprot:XP_014149425.1 hypothetical protein SARC_11956 [Sphaeroforma arctica JP610]
MSRWIRSISLGNGMSSHFSEDENEQNDTEMSPTETLTRQHTQQNTKLNSRPSVADETAVEVQDFLKNHVHAFDVKMLVSYNLKKGRISRDVLVMTLIYNQKLTSLDARKHSQDCNSGHASAQAGTYLSQSQDARNQVDCASAYTSDSDSDMNMALEMDNSVPAGNLQFIDPSYQSDKNPLDSSELPSRRRTQAENELSVEKDIKIKKFGKLRPREVAECEAVLSCSQCRFLGCLILASKYTEDTVTSNKQWADSTRMPVWYVNKIERHLLYRLEFNLHVPGNLWDKWCKVVYAQVLSTMGFPTDPTAVGLLNTQFSDTNTHDLISAARRRVTTYASEVGTGVISNVASMLPAPAAAFAAPVIATYFPKFSNGQIKSGESDIENVTQGSPEVSQLQQQSGNMGEIQSTERNGVPQCDFSYQQQQMQQRMQQQQQQQHQQQQQVQEQQEQQQVQQQQQQQQQLQEQQQHLQQQQQQQLQEQEQQQHQNNIQEQLQQQQQQQQQQKQQQLLQQQQLQQLQLQEHLHQQFEQQKQEHIRQQMQLQYEMQQQYAEQQANQQQPSDPEVQWRYQEHYEHRQRELEAQQYRERQSFRETQRKQYEDYLRGKSTQPQQQTQMQPHAHDRAQALIMSNSRELSGDRIQHQQHMGLPPQRGPPTPLQVLSPYLSLSYMGGDTAARTSALQVPRPHSEPPTLSNINQIGSIAYPIPLRTPQLVPQDRMDIYQQ